MRRPPPELYVERLSPEHLKSFADFRCGDDEWDIDLAEFLRDDALAEGEGRFNTTYVFFDKARNPVAYVTLSNAEVRNEPGGAAVKLLAGAPYRTISALLIGRLAVDQRYQGRGIGAAILAWIRATADSLPVGCRFLALHVDERNEAATRFYTGAGFFCPPHLQRQHHLRLMLCDLVASA